MRVHKIIKMDYKNNIGFRKASLEKLLKNIEMHENEIVDALYKDFKKPVLCEG